LFKKYKCDLNTEVNKKQPTNEFWDKFRKYAEEFIDILSQIEELKKLVWLQKKNVLKSDYVITIDRIVEA